jgi:serine/threonine protein kinase
MSLPAGKLLAQYEIVAPLGSGGMGEVYRAKDLRLGRDVAVKVMAKHIAADPEMRRRFEIEARSVASLSHPSILSIHELAVVDDVPMAVMELLEGENLRSRIRRGALPWRDAVRIAATVAEGLAAAHSRGIVHRDLKPENIFLTSDDGVKILDFGLALQRLESPLAPDVPTMAVTNDRAVMGTFGYMSPEQVTGERVDGRSDIFALGCVLYEMLTGRALFAGETPQEIIARLMHDTGIDLTAFDPFLPAEMRPILLRCIDRVAARRFESAHDLAMALHALQSGSGSTLTGRRKTQRGKSLAVLPFVNAVADPSVEYLTDGITESIINSLSQLSGLRVVPRSLAFRYKGLQADPATVGLALNARTILTGRVVQQGDFINIQAELVDTNTESQLWGEQFRQKITELATLQQEIAWQISEALRLKLTSKQKTRLRKKATVNPEAYQEYLRGRYLWNNWTPESFRRSLEHFERAISIDPAYGAAYAGLADAVGVLAYYGVIPPEDGFMRAKAAARRALELDPEFADAHASLGLSHLFWDHDWPAAEREFKAAIDLNGQLALPHTLYAFWLMSIRRFDESIAEARTAQHLDPLSLFVNMGLCWAYHGAGRYEEAIRETLRTRELSRDSIESVNLLVNCYEETGRFEQAARLCGEYPVCGVRAEGDELLDAFRRGGEQAYWRKRLELLRRAPDQSGRITVFTYALIHAYLGEDDLVYDRMERLVDGRAGNCVFFNVAPAFKHLRQQPRFLAILRRVGVPTASAPHTVST